MFNESGVQASNYLYLIFARNLSFDLMNLKIYSASFHKPRKKNIFKFKSVKEDPTDVKLASRLFKR